mmetsp:Transcript_82579/g.256803  ORF Transcript_82579/g.256803 Transcript_82579/m.256803 type:complete len:218 (+) Transcript_82579:354-1007(+)
MARRGPRGHAPCLPAVHAGHPPRPSAPPWAPAPARHWASVRELPWQLSPQLGPRKTEEAPSAAASPRVPEAAQAPGPRPLRRHTWGPLNPQWGCARWPLPESAGASSAGPPRNSQGGVMWPATPRPRQGWDPGVPAEHLGLLPLCCGEPSCGQDTWVTRALTSRERRLMFAGAAWTRGRVQCSNCRCGSHNTVGGVRMFCKGADRTSCSGAASAPCR